MNLSTAGRGRTKGQARPVTCPLYFSTDRTTAAAAALTLRSARHSPVLTPFSSSFHTWLSSSPQISSSSKLERGSCSRQQQPVGSLVHRRGEGSRAEHGVGEVAVVRRAPAADGRGPGAGGNGRVLGARVEPGRDADNGGRAGGRHRLHAALLRLLLALAEAQRDPAVTDREPVAAVELGPAAHGPGLHPRRHRQLLQGQQARRGRIRPSLQGRAERRRRDRREAAVGAVAAGRRRVPQRGGAHRQAAAPQPGQAAGLVRRARGEAARLRVPAQPQPRRLPLRSEQERAAGVERAPQHHPGHRPGHALPPRGLAAQGGPPGPQGQQRAPRPQDEPQDLRLRHGQDLRGRVRRHQHRTRRRNIRVHGAGVRAGGRLLRQVRRVQLRSPAAGDLERPAERRLVPGGAPAVAHPRRMEAVDRGSRRRVHGPVAGAILLQGGDVAVLPRRPSLRAGGPRRPADHVQRPAHAHQRPHQAP